MTKTLKIPLVVALALVGVLLVVPKNVSAAPADASLRGGGNALFNTTTGITNAHPKSDIFSRLTFSGTRGQKLEEDGSPPQEPEVPPQTNAGQNRDGGYSVQADPGDGNNGGAVAGNGGNGADGNGAGDGGNGGFSATGGLVRAGGVVSNSTAINMINAVIIRIGG